MRKAIAQYLFKVRSLIAVGWVEEKKPSVTIFPTSAIASSLKYYKMQFPKTMPYNKFTLRKVVEDFSLQIVEDGTFIPELAAIAPSELLRATLADSLPWAVAVGSEKARSEAIITPVLLEVRRLLNRQISVFSGEDFTVDVDAELTGRCDFLVSRSPEQLFIKAPAVIIVEAKKEDTKSGLGQCVAEMVAAQKFNARANQSIPVIYGCVTSGTAWRFLKLEEQIVTIDLTDYPLPPVEHILSILLWMLQD